MVQETDFLTTFPGSYRKWAGSLSFTCLDAVDPWHRQDSSFTPWDLLLYAVIERPEHIPDCTTSSSLSSIPAHCLLLHCQSFLIWANTLPLNSVGLCRTHSSTLSPIAIGGNTVPCFHRMQASSFQEDNSITRKRTHFPLSCLRGDEMEAFISSLRC